MEKKAEKLDSDEELLNLDNELYSLTHYADNEEELVAQMFASVKGSKLEMMMPPIFKEIPLIDLQQLCLHELRGMSQRRILSIINGQEMSGSSSEDQESDDDLKPLKDQGKSNSGGISTKAVLAEAEEALSHGDEAVSLKKMDLLELEMRAKLIKTMLDKQDNTGIKQELPNDDNHFDPNIKIKQEPLSPKSSRSNSHHSSRRSYSRSSSYSSDSSYSSYSSRSRSSHSVTKRNKKRDSSSNSDSEDDKKTSKKKLTKKEFEARMKKAKMNRSYRRRKGSEEESGDENQKGKMSSSDAETKEKDTEMECIDTKSKTLEDDQLDENLMKEEMEVDQNAITDQPEGEDNDEEEGEVSEKEEGEIDSNDETAKNDSGAHEDEKENGASRSYARSGSNRSYSSYSSRSRSQSPVRRHRSKKKKRSRRHRKRYSRSNSPTEKDVPKIPNWNANEESMLPTNRNREKVESGLEIASRECVELNLPGKEERQSISFSINKKLAPGKSNPELNDDGIPGQTSQDLSNKVEETCDQTLSRLSVKDLLHDESDNDVVTSGNQVETTLKLLVNKENFASEDFYKGADQLNFSEEETQEEEVEAVYDSPEPPLEGDSKSKLIDNQSDHEIENEAVEDVSEDQSSQLEIIGTIDPKETDAFEQTIDEDLAGGSASWSMRWLQSEKVQKVVSNSKMLSKVRKNIQAKGKKAPGESQNQSVSKLENKDEEAQQIPKQIQGSAPSSTTATAGGVIGSMEEYEKMFGIKVKAPTSLPQPKPAPKPTTSSSSLPASLLDSDGDEDSEDDAIWSKIMKK